MYRVERLKIGRKHGKKKQQQQNTQQAKKQKKCTKNCLDGITWKGKATETYKRK